MLSEMLPKNLIIMLIDVYMNCQHQCRALLNFSKQLVANCLNLLEGSDTMQKLNSYENE